jgi:hypothetical protein
MTSPRFTVDLEDWYHSLDVSLWSGLESCFESQLNFLLEFLSQNKIEALFYTVGYVAQRYPNAIKNIVSCNHKIGSHSFYHKNLSCYSKKEFKVDLYKCTQVLQDITQRNVVDYRLPEFSYTFNNDWFYPLLIENGYKSDSSLLYKGFNGLRIQETLKKYNSENFNIFPVFSPSIFNFHIPVFGGSYLRLCPKFILQYLCSKYSKKTSIYIHLREYTKVSLPPNLKFYKKILYNSFQKNLITKILIINNNLK